MMKNNHFALIMAGGMGTRFWPWSTAEKPKQFLNVIGEDSLIKQTYLRLTKIMAAQNIYVVADKVYLPRIKEAIPGFSETNFISEPAPRNTAPCLILANIRLSLTDEDANLLVVPADHYIPDEELFSSQIKDALEYADNKFIITCGIKPTEAHTGYGYIQFSTDDGIACGGTEFFQVREFKEKPKRQVAEHYLRQGNYCWNSGMFIYKLKHFKEFFFKYSPEYSGYFRELERNISNQAEFERIFKAIKPESIDYALMEKVKEVKLFMAEFSWSDVGSWSSVYELSSKDQNLNTSNRKNNILIDSENSMVFNTQSKNVALIGIKDIVVINTEHGVLVARRQDLQKVKEVLDKIRS